MTKRSIEYLADLVVTMSASGVNNKEKFRVWRKDNAEYYASCLGLDGRKDCPPPTSLVTAFFHPRRRLVGLNYTQVAHNLLHAVPGGWTPAIRRCRGIVFQADGQLVGLPFEKFFNYGEQPESAALPHLPFVATVKHDGHMGEAFWHRDRWLMTTRGDFTSASAKIGQTMLDAKTVRKEWRDPEFKRVTLLFEIIHPKTRVFLNYGRQRKLVLIGAYDLDRLCDLEQDRLDDIGRYLRLPVAERWQGSDLSDLNELMRDLSVANREGFVVRFANGLRVKFKFQSYLNMMVADKLSYPYLMRRIMAGDLRTKIMHLPEEVYAQAQGMAKALLKVKRMRGPEKERLVYLYTLLPPEKRTYNFRKVCREFLAHQTRTP